MLHMLASVLSFGLFRSTQAVPVETLRISSAAPHENPFSKSGGGLPWRKRRFRHMRGIATPDWQNAEPIYIVEGSK